MQSSWPKRSAPSWRAAPPSTRFTQAGQRAKLVLQAAQGLTKVEIGARLDINPKLVGRWRRRFCEARLVGLEDRARSGRPRRFPLQEVARVKAVACQPPSEGAPL
jgi:transposase